MGRFSAAKTGFSGDNTPLALGTYGTNREAGLEIVHFLGSRTTKDPELMQYTYLVVATDEARLGSSFLKFSIKRGWLEEGALALAFPELQLSIYSKTALEKLLDVAIETNADEEAAREHLLAEAETVLRAKAKAKAEANNAPETADDIYKKAIQQININVGHVWRLQDWHGYDRDALMIWHSPAQLVGCCFGGKVKESKDKFVPAPTPNNPNPQPSPDVDIFTCKCRVDDDKLLKYTYTVPAEEAEADDSKPPF